MTDQFSSADWDMTPEADHTVADSQQDNHQRTLTDLIDEIEREAFARSLAKRIAARPTANETGPNDEPDAHHTD